MYSTYTNLHSHVYMCVYAYIHRNMCVAKCFSNFFAGPINPRVPVHGHHFSQVYYSHAFLHKAIF